MTQSAAFLSSSALQRSCPTKTWQLASATTQSLSVSATRQLLLQLYYVDSNVQANYPDDPSPVDAH